MDFVSDDVVEQTKQVKGINFLYVHNSYFHIDTM